jgi:hypothetical protein
MVLIPLDLPMLPLLEVAVLMGGLDREEKCPDCGIERSFGTDPEGDYLELDRKLF